MPANTYNQMDGKMNISCISSYLSIFGGALGIVSWLLALCLHHGFLNVNHEQSQWLLVMLPVILLFVVSSLGVVARIIFAVKEGGETSPVPFVRFSRRIQWLHSVVVLSYGLIAFIPEASGVLYFLISPAIWTWSLSAWFSVPDRTSVIDEYPSARLAVGVFIGFTIIHALTGLYYTVSVGEHSGDEGHYLTQAQSLYEDGDLDIRNQFKNPETVARERVHISPMSLNGKWYSWHSPGLSFLLAPVMGSHLLLRHLLLGAISGWSLAGCFLLACTLGARHKHALLVTTLLGGGVFWGVYASRALPEVLGAGLTTWGLYGVLKQKRWPWLSMLLVWGCIGFLPWTHTRFLPVAAVLVGCYGLDILLEPGAPWKRTIGRGLVFTLSAAGVLLFYYIMQHRFFENGMSYPVPNLLFSLPAGLWHSLLSSRGIVFMFPLFACGLAATLRSVLNRKQALPALYTILLFLSVWLSSCATVWFTAGACMPGRFLLVVVPVITVWVAVTLNPQRKVPLYFVLYTGVYGIAFLVAQLSILPAFGKSFSNPLNLEQIHPLFPSLFRFDYDPLQTMGPGPALWLFLGVMALFLVARWSTPMVDWCILMAIGVVYAFNFSFGSPFYVSPHQTALKLERMRLDQFHCVLNLSSSREPQSLFDISDRFYECPGFPVKSVTTEDLGALVKDEWISTPYLTENDWDGRPYAWATLVPPFPSGRGPWAFLLEAELVSDSGAELAIREGAFTHKIISIPPGTRFSDVYTIETRRRGDVYVLIRFLGKEAKWISHRLSVSRYSDKILSSSNLILDAKP